jgi:tRNA1(Val) A37 N6-methylase TrmN6
MKGGTDGVLLGAWARVGHCNHILDIGTGTGLVALMAAGVGYLQYLQRGNNEKQDSRISVLEVQMSNQVKDLDNFKVLLYDIRSDVSFIRGKLEKEK